MRGGTFEIETVAGLETIFLAVDGDFEFTTKYVDKFFALVRVRIAAACLGCDPKKMRLHDGVAPSEQFHADSVSGFEHFSLGGAHLATAGAASVEEIKDVGFIEAR